MRFNHHDMQTCMTRWRSLKRTDTIVLPVSGTWERSRGQPILDHLLVPDIRSGLTNRAVARLGFCSEGTAPKTIHAGVCAFVCGIVWSLVCLALLCAGFGALVMADTPIELRQWTEIPDPTAAQVIVRANVKAPYRVPRHITGKFAEHLGWNINNGMCAQILRNPTFADYPFWTGQMTPDGLTKFHADENRIAEEIRRLATRFGWPEHEIQGLIQARSDGLACFWTRLGLPDDVEVSPDTAPNNNRAQRVAVKRPNCGIGQWTWFPLHRTRKYEFELFLRSPDLQSIRVVVSEGTRDNTFASVVIDGVSQNWQKFRSTLEVPASFPLDKPALFSIRSDLSGQFVIGYALLYPADHVCGADPDVIKLLKDSRLPILRWPGGNFASTYHWEDGIGPFEQRPTRPNFAWGGVEPNLFGTDEFIEFCRAVGCEPMICINAGSGSPAEAARWVEYCNGNTETPMGKLRAAHGYLEPHGVKHWEIGNELWGRWQYRWTTASGYVDRLKQFAAAMRAVDPTIRIYACGAPVFWGKEWNDTLVTGAVGVFDAVTDHPLIGGNVDIATDPIDVFRDFMAVPEVLERKWAQLSQTMKKAGLTEPRLAITELQVFAHLGQRSDPNQPIRLTRENLPDQDSITEAIYDVLVYHAAIRLGPFVDMITHSATVNHGGGLRKERERLYVNPCHYAQSIWTVFAGATPVQVHIKCSAEKAPCVLPDLRRVVSDCSFGIVDALAAIADDGSILISLVNRGATSPVRVTIEFDGFAPGNKALVTRLEGEHPWSGNSLENPDAVAPRVVDHPVKGGHLELQLAPFGITVLRIPPAES